MLSVEYDRPAPGLHTDLFVKFSRDFDNPVRDRGKTQMEPEVRFAALSRAPGFPIAVPSVQFADYHRQTGTGILITERIRFGDNGIERQYHKCLDYEMPDPLEHYRALLTALARLAGAHRSGRLPADLIAHFPLDVQAATVGERAPLSADKLDRRLTQLVEFVATHPGLLPAVVGSPEFLARLREDVPRVAHHERTVARQLAADSDYVALCHWNANIDNAWFWRDAAGVLRCGLMDWGCVGQMNLGMAVWEPCPAPKPRCGAGISTNCWIFSSPKSVAAAVRVSTLTGYSGTRCFTRRRWGSAWLLDVPALIRKRFGAVPNSRRDPRIRDDESVRAPLQMLSNLLTLWERYRLGDLLDAALAEEARVR